MVGARAGIKRKTGRAARFLLPPSLPVLDSWSKIRTIQETTLERQETMDAITYSHARENLAETMRRVCDDHVPIIITRQKERAVVIMSLEDWNAYEETAYLLRNPANAARLRSSIAQHRAGNIQQHDLIENEQTTKD